jgi:hypothetical protein
VPSNVLPSEDCVFRLDSRDGYKQPFDVTFVDVGLTDDEFVFDGVTSRIDIDNDIRFETDRMTFEAIVHPVHYNQSTGGIISKSYDTFAIVSEGSNDSLLVYAGSTDSYVRSTNASIPRNEDTYVTVVIESGVSILIYINGILNASKLTSVDPFVFNGEILQIGYRFGGYRFGGLISHVSIYSRALTSAEVKDRYKQRTFNIS